MRMVVVSVVAVLCVPLLGCPAAERSGLALPLNMQPAPPSFAGAFDFDLLDEVQGHACASSQDPTAVHWLSFAGLEKVSSDGLTTQAINAAAYEAVKLTADADSMVATRVVTESHGPSKVCATVTGRAIRLKKAAAPHVERDDAPPKDDAKDGSE